MRLSCPGRNKLEFVGSSAVEFHILVARFEGLDKVYSMAVLIQSSTNLPFPSHVAAPSRPGSSSQLLLTVVLFLLLIVGRVAGYTAANSTAKKRPISTAPLPSQRFQVPVSPGVLPSIPAPAKTQATALTTAAR